MINTFNKNACEKILINIINFVKKRSYINFINFKLRKNLQYLYKLQF